MRTRAGTRVVSKDSLLQLEIKARGLTKILSPFSSPSSFLITSPFTPDVDDDADKDKDEDEDKDKDKDEDKDEDTHFSSPFSWCLKSEKTCIIFLTISQLATHPVSCMLM